MIVVVPSNCLAIMQVSRPYIHPLFLVVPHAAFVFGPRLGIHNYYCLVRVSLLIPEMIAEPVFVRLFLVIR